MVNRTTQDKRTAANEAQRILLELGVTLGQLAAVTGKSRQAASMWMNGSKLPDADDGTREAIEAKWADAKAKLWEVVAGAEELPPAPATAAPDGDGENYEVRMRAHLASVEGQIRSAEASGRLGDWVKLCTLKQRILNDLAKFTGQLTPADEARLTKTKQFVRVRTAIAKALVPYPEAGQAVEEALRTINA